MQHKVLIYSPTHTAFWGGGQIYIEQLCHYMNKNGVVCHILSSNPDSFSCPTKTMPVAHPKYRRFTAAFGIAKRYKAEGYKTIILNDLASLWLAPIFKMYGFRVISLLHLYLRKKEGEGLGHAPLQYHLLKQSASFCDEILSVNRDNVKTFGEERVTFVGNYVPDWFFEAPKNPDAKKYDFILIARFAIEKNIPLFIELLKRLNDASERSFNALIIGEGPQKENIERAIDEHGLEDHISLQGWVERSELPQVYDLGKCFVISSHHEGFATTLLEAHARGIPAIVTRTSGFCVDFVEKYGEETGLVYDKEDISDTLFLDRLKRMIEDHTEYEEKCITKAKHFSEENVLGPIVTIVKEER